MVWSRTAKAFVCFGSVTGRTTEQSLKAHLSALLAQDLEYITKELEAKGDECVFNVPALRGVQGGRNYHAVTMPYRVLARLLQIQIGLAAIERAQREVNKSQVTDLVDCMGQAGYTLPALTGCVEGKAEFTGDHMGTLAIDMGAKILLADGQHRASAIVNKVEGDATLAGESVII